MDNNQTMYEHETVKKNYVKQTEGIVEAAKCHLVTEGNKSAEIKGTSKEKQVELTIFVPPREELQPFGFSYHNVKQNSQDWFDLRTGKITCSMIGSLIGLAGENHRF